MTRITWLRFSFLFLFLFLFAPLFIRCNNYTVDQLGDIVVVDQFNTITSSKLKTNSKGIFLELETVAKFPVYCIPFSAIDRNSPNSKKPIYFIKQEFENSFDLYRNNVKLMPITFNDKKYVTDIAVNNGLILMITDIHFYVVDFVTKNITLTALNNVNGYDLSEIKNVFFSSLISGVNMNEFFATAIKTEKSFILHLKYNDENNNLEILNIIDSYNGKPLKLVNGITVTKSALYVSENSQYILRYRITENEEVEPGEIIQVFEGLDVISLNGNTVFDKNKNMFIDYVLVNSKTSQQTFPSSESLIYLIKIEDFANAQTYAGGTGANGKEKKGIVKFVKFNSEQRKYSHGKKKSKRSVNVYNIIDLFSKDMNYIYFDIYDIYFSFDEVKDKSLEGRDKLFDSLKTNTTRLHTDKKNKKSRQHPDIAMGIYWTNTYSCSINKGWIDLEKMRKLDSHNEIKKTHTDIKSLPLVDARVSFSLVPYVSAITHCSLKKKNIFKSLCIYNADENSVSYIHKPINYNSDFKSPFLFDGIKDYLAFDYKCYRTVHILSYPYNNTLFVHTANTDLKLILPTPFGIAIDTERSSEREITFYIAGNDEHYNYISKCVVDLIKSDYECYDSYRKKRNEWELFQHISYISYITDDKSTLTHIYITNNRRSVYMLNKVDSTRWKFQTLFNLEDPHEIIGVISTSVNYFFVNRRALTRLIKKYPHSVMLMNANDRFEYENRENDKQVAQVGTALNADDEEEFSFLLQSHTLIYTVNKDSYGYNSGTSLHFYAVLLREEFYTEFIYNGIIKNISNEAKFNYFVLA